MVSDYFDFSEMQAIRHRLTYMSNYVEHLDNILRATGEEVLTHAGKSSHCSGYERLKHKSIEQYAKKDIITASP